MKANFTGKQLHTLMVKNNKSLKDSASALGISLEEMQSYLEYRKV